MSCPADPGQRKMKKILERELKVLKSLERKPMQVHFPATLFHSFLSMASGRHFSFCEAPLACQEYLILDQSDTVVPAHAVVWMTNWKITDSDWVSIPTRLLVRGLVPAAIIRMGSVFALEVLDASGEPLLESAVRSGCWLSMENLKLVFAHLELSPPTSGSGKRLANGRKRVLKVDWAKKLVDSLFPGAELAKKVEMVNALCFKAGGGGKLSEEDANVLDMVAALDEENREAPEFKKVAKLAKKQLAESAEKRGRAAAALEMDEKEKQRQKEQEEERAKTEAEAKMREEARMKDLELAKKAVEAVKEAPQELASASSSKPESAPGTRRPSQTPEHLHLLLTLQMGLDGMSLNRDPTAYGYRLTLKNAKPGQQRNFQRKWPTAACPTEADALESVLEFAYFSWNSDNPKRTAARQAGRTWFRLSFFPLRPDKETIKDFVRNLHINLQKKDQAKGDKA